MSKTITCPNCFHTFKPDSVQFECTNASCADYGQPFEIENSGFSLFNTAVPVRADCPTCNVETFKRLCPECGFELTHDAGLNEEFTVAIIGGRGTGKSTYIAALIHRLKNEIGLTFQVGVGAMNDYTRERFRDDFETPLFRQKRLLAPTQSARQEINTKTPMIFRITFKKKVVNLVLFDTAGEDMQSLDMMSVEARYISFADGLIFLLDPLQIDTVRQQLAGTGIPLPAPDPGAEPQLIVERLRQLYERQFNLRGTRKIKKPIAFTLAKIDALYSILDPSSSLHSVGGHAGTVNTADIQSVHTEISSILLNWMGPAFENFVRVHFDTYKFFGTSALGEPPNADNEIVAVAPHRVEDPLLWIFLEFGIVKAG